MKYPNQLKKRVKKTKRVKIQSTLDKCCSDTNDFVGNFREKGGIDGEGWSASENTLF